MGMIELNEISKTYDLGEVKVEALKGATLSIERGDHIALTGQSGSGKSTLMNILGCLDRPTGGSYQLDGDEISQLTPNDRAKIRNDRIGFVFQNFNLLARTSALENVELPMMYSSSVTARQRHERATEMLELVGMGDRMTHFPSQLSGGQQQRVAIARALINEPSILLADEPTGNLDTRTSRDVMNLFRRLNEENGITIILVTHEQEAARCARRWFVLRDGDIVTDTTDFDQALQSLHSTDELEPVVQDKPAG
jgi:putative ABC transport system ATP-binding protein